MSITLLQISANVDGDRHEVKARFAPREKALRKPEVRKAIVSLLEEVLEGLKDGKGTDGGQRGFWREIRVEEVIVDKKEQEG